MIASDAQNPEFLGATNPDARLFVEFYNKPMLNEFKTLGAGREIWEDVVFVKIQVPGDTTFNVDTPAWDSHKQRFPHHWARFQNAHANETQMIGTPLSQWPLLSPSAVQELKYQKYMTVEQVAGASDAQISNLGMSGGIAPFTLRERAQRFLEAANGEAIVNERAEELKKLKEEQLIKDTQHAEELATLKAQMASLMEMMTKEPAKRGPKPKDKEAA